MITNCYSIIWTFMLKNFLRWNLGRATVIWNSLLIYTFIPLNASIVLGHGHQSERTFKNKLTFILNASLNSSNKSSTVRLFSARSFPGCFSSSSSLPSSLFFDSSKLCINKETWEPFPAGLFSAAMLTVSDVVYDQPQLVCVLYGKLVLQLSHPTAYQI